MESTTKTRLNFARPCVHPGKCERSQTNAGFFSPGDRALRGPLVGFGYLVFRPPRIPALSDVLPREQQ